MIRSRRGFLTLDAIRGVAALAVVLYHGARLFGPVVANGFLAVDLFFVLSGFVVAHAYDARIAGGMSAAAFARLRMIRFFPLYATGLGIGLVRELLLIGTHNRYALSPPQLAGALSLNAVFLPFPTAGRGDALFPLNVPSWSLFMELGVNILYAALFPRLTRPVLCVVAAASAAVLVVTLPGDGLHRVGTDLATLPGGIARTVFSFSVGLLLYRGGIRTMAVPVWLVLAATAALLALPLTSRLYELAFVLVASPLLVAFGASVEPSPQLASTARTLGLASFPIYALHWPVLAIVDAACRAARLDARIVGAAAIAALLLFCVMVAVPLDRRLQRAITRWLGGDRRLDAAPTAAP